MPNLASLARASRSCLLPLVLLPAIGALLSVAMSTAAPADNNAALQQCRMTVGRRIVQSCMQHGQGDTTSCRQKARPAVKRCVMHSGTMGSGPHPDTMAGGGFAGRRGAAMAGREGRLAKCKELAYQRGFNGGIKDRGAVGAFVKSCVQGKSF